MIVLSTIGTVKILQAITPCHFPENREVKNWSMSTNNLLHVGFRKPSPKKDFKLCKSYLICNSSEIYAVQINF